MDERQSRVSIYGLVDPARPDDVRYVGKSVSPERRLRKHVEEARRGTDTYKCRWIRIVLTAGRKPAVIVLASVTSERATEAEIDWIERLREEGHSLVNTARGGLGGHTLTREDLAARAQAMRARWADPDYRAQMVAAHTGKAHDETARRKVSEAAQAAWDANPERKLRLVAARLGKSGRPMTPELRQKLSAAITGTRWSDKRRALFEQKRRQREAASGHLPFTLTTGKCPTTD